jgi:Cytochrome c554 and c-prime
VLFLCALVAAAAVIVIFAGSRDLVTSRIRNVMVAACCSVIVVALTIVAMTSPATDPLLSDAALPDNENSAPGPGVPGNRPIEDHAGGYVGADTCRSCHEREHETWYASYHRTMTQVAGPESIIGEFNVNVSFPGMTFRLRRENNEFFFDVPPAGNNLPGRPADSPSSHQIVLTTGSHHMQVCWYALGDDTRILGMVPFTFLKEDQRWVPRHATFLKPPAPPPMSIGRWNTSCIRCHATHGRVNVDGPLTNQQSLSDQTRVAEFGIACEACHGPGQEHVRRMNLPVEERTDADVQMLHPGRVSHRLSSQVCGQCHSVQRFEADQVLRWVRDGFDYRPGDDLQQSSMRHLVQCSGDVQSEFPDDWQTQFWSDGMVRVSGREYNGLVESPCFEHGDMSCLSCHQMHPSADDSRKLDEWADDQLKTGMRNNRACTQCHEKYKTAASLAEHTHHLADSSGSSCYNCHMSYTTYGLLKAIRSHRIDSPNVQTSLNTGRPNACNQCHLDKTLAWSSDQLSDWYDIDPPQLTQDQQSVAASVIWSLSGDAGQRALMAWSFGWKDAQQVSGTEWMAPHLGQLLQDPYDAVRYIAHRSLMRIPGFESFDYDFVGDPAQCSTAALRVRKQWNGTASTIPAHRVTAVLVEPDGKTLRPDFRRLLDQRNDQPIRLNE